MNTHYIGKAGEHFVAGQLLMRDIPVSFPCVDTGVDLFAGAQGKIRIQVKSSRRHDYRRGGYVFTLGSRKPKDGHKQYWLALKDWANTVDFLVCCGIDDQRFWVIPSSVLASFPKVQSLILGTGHHKQIDHDKIRQLRAAGRTQRYIAEALGVSELTVHHSVNGRGPKGAYANSLAVEADKYENAWHEIEAALALTNEINSIEVADMAQEKH